MNLTDKVNREKDFAFVGRHEEISLLDRLLNSVCLGHMQSVIVTGEAGIGKTRLVQEFVKQSFAEYGKNGIAVWWGRAQTIQKGVAFSPLLQSLRVAIAGLSSKQRHEFAEKYPYLSVFFAELGRGKMPDPAGQRVERTWLFETLRRFVVDLAMLRPTIFWIDDLPEADEDTLDWLQYFLHHTEHCRVLFIGTCRTQTPGSENSNDNVMMSDWIQQGQVQHIALGPLGQPETEELITNFSQGKVDEKLQLYVRDLATGIPLFIIEMLHMMMDNLDSHRDERLASISQFSNEDVPQRISAIITKRIHNMPQLDRTILQFLAVNDNALPWTVLCRVTDQSEDLLTATLSNLVRADLIREIDSDYDIEYVVRHPLIKMTVYQQLSGIEVRQIHKELAGAWRGDMVRFAHHVRLAGSSMDAQEAISVLYDAGLYYISLRAYQSACDYLEQAWKMAISPFVSLPIEQEVDIQVALAQVYSYMNRRAEATDLLDSLYLNASTDSLKLRLKRLFAWTLSTHSPHESSKHIKEGLRYWDGVTANDDVFWMMRELVDNSTNTGDTVQAKKYLDQMREYVRRFPNDRNGILLATHEVIIQVIDWKGEMSKNIDGEVWINRAVELGDPEAIYDVYCVFGYHALNRGDFLTTIRYASDCVKWVRRFGMVQHEISIRLMHLCGLLMAGRWREALREAHDVKKLAEDHDSAYAVLCTLDFLALLSAMQGSQEESEAYRKESLLVAERVLPIHPVMQTGQTVSPAEAVTMLVNQQPQIKQPLSVVWAISHGLPVFLTLLEGFQHIGSGATESAVILVEELRRAAGTRKLTYFAGVADLLDGLLAKRQSNTKKALELVKNSYDTFMLLGTPFESAVAQLSWADIARYRYPKQAVIEAEQSRTMFEGLGALPFVQLAQKLLEPSEISSEVSHSLSARELEIVRCVARGLSNKQIAETLMISHRTVSTHLDKIYKKMEVGSRTELISKFNPNEW